MKSILTFITAMLAAVLLIPAASAQSTSNPKTQVRVTLDKLSLYMRQSPTCPRGRSAVPAQAEEVGGF